MGVSTHLVGDAVVVGVGVAFVAHLVVVGVGLGKEKRHLVTSSFCLIIIQPGMALPHCNSAKIGLQPDLVSVGLVRAVVDGVRNSVAILIIVGVANVAEGVFVVISLSNFNAVKNLN